MRILITGGSGFIGRHLLPEMLRRGHRLTVVDVEVPRHKEELDGGFLHKGVEDLLPRDLEEAEAVVHLAALTNVGLSNRSPKWTITSNTEMTIHMLEMMRATPGFRQRKLVWMSTQSVYGVASKVPTPETEPTAPVDPYGASKAACEGYVGTYSRSFGIPSVTLRAATVYGKGGKAVPNIWLNAARDGLPISIEGDGNQSRDLLYVGDMVAAIIAAVEAPKVEGTFNVSTGKDWPLLDLANMIIGVTGSRAGIVHNAGRTRDGRVLLDAGKIKREIGWEAKVTLKEGLERTWSEMGR